MRETMRTLALSLALLALAPAARAATIYDNGLPDHLNGVGSDPDIGVGPTDTQVTADDFVLGSAGILDGATWFGVYAINDTPPALDDFTLTIYQDAAGLPGAVLASAPLGAASRLATGSTTGSFDEYQYSASFGPIALPGGVPLWFSVVNDTTPDGDFNNWYWLSSKPGTHANQTIVGNPFFVDTSALAAFDVAFSLQGTLAPVPEPSTLALLGLGLGAVVRRRRRR